MRALYEIIMLVRIAKVKTNYTTLDSLKLSEVGSLSEEIIDEYLFLIDEIFIDINDMVSGILFFLSLQEFEYTTLSNAPLSNQHDNHFFS